MVDKMKRKNARGVSVIGGADGPTSVFIAGNVGKPSLNERIKRYFYRRKRKRIERMITANPHTLEEVIGYLQDTYGAVEVSKQSHAYMEQHKCLKESLILQHKPELLGDMAELKRPTDYDEKSLQEFWKSLELRRQKAESIPDEMIPMDLHLYRIILPEVGEMHFSIETVWSIFGSSYSGSKEGMKQMHQISKAVYLYYGVTEEDIRNKTDRYTSLVTTLCV